MHWSAYIFYKGLNESYCQFCRSCGLCYSYLTLSPTMKAATGNMTVCKQIIVAMFQLKNLLKKNPGNRLGVTYWFPSFNIEDIQACKSILSKMFQAIYIAHQCLFGHFCYQLFPQKICIIMSVLANFTCF